jgi:hypothetical protein
MKKYENLAKAIYDIGKYSFTALVIGQFIAGKFSVKAMIAGVVFTLLAFYTAVKFEKIKEG